MTCCTVRGCQNISQHHNKDIKITFHASILWVLLKILPLHGKEELPPIEGMHHKYLPTADKFIAGVEVPNYKDTPDFRLQETAWIVLYGTFSKEQGRPYRMSPPGMQAERFDYYFRYWGHKVLHAYRLACYCTTVYKRYTVLAGCAVLTTRHLLTTATASDLILKHYRGVQDLEGILGAWYDIEADNIYNASYYMTPARIHFHPRYLRAEDVNVTHPLPFVFDLAVWTATTPFHYTPILATLSADKVALCWRGAPHNWNLRSSTPVGSETAAICGFQYVKAARKIPMPWFRYCTFSKYYVKPCPKTEWGWFHCMNGYTWSKYGIDSGAAYHRCLKNEAWAYDGLIALGSFSLYLRSDHIVHYFTVVNSHPVLNFIYDSYYNFIPAEYEDQRFRHLKNAKPLPKYGFYIREYRYEEPLQTYEGYMLPFW